jgi:hypothetical protein
MAKMPTFLVTPDKGGEWEVVASNGSRASGSPEHLTVWMLDEMHAAQRPLDYIDAVDHVRSRGLVGQEAIRQVAHLCMISTEAAERHLMNSLARP